MLPGQALPSFHITHTSTVSPTLTLHISHVNTLMIDISVYHNSNEPKSILGWWITAFRDIEADSALKVVRLKIDVKNMPSLSTPNYGDLWKQMNEALNGIPSLKTVDLTFYNMSPDWPWNEAEAQMIEGFKMRDPQRELNIHVTTFSSSQRKAQTFPAIPLQFQVLQLHKRNEMGMHRLDILNMSQSGTLKSRLKGEIIELVTGRNSREKVKLVDMYREEL
ncbi:uncharacterized protein EV420DRAFT_1486211 [Desarmillaria tabescens]|uniref:Uncharacterized protein n=1 Tax=Armillaria tabescens TaxID=1929756 RepID=A0AA39JBG4_ARMTA|nr:uncharacterized protein EV420DRAFT_1486211 [Desarmillaria tabescens]KAK0439687.1 hypothetical protein EV420DRAFT_1486211 [Desarmillaria tabescens]